MGTLSGKPENYKAHHLAQRLGRVTLNHASLAILGLILSRPGYPPSLREMMAAADLDSPNGVLSHIRRLKKLGLVTSADGHARQRTWRATCRFIPAEGA